MQDISKLTITELKALKCDLYESISKSSTLLKQVSKRIFELQEEIKNPTVVEPVPGTEPIIK